MAEGRTLQVPAMYDVHCPRCNNAVLEVLIPEGSKYGVAMPCACGVGMAEIEAMTEQMHEQMMSQVGQSVHALVSALTSTPSVKPVVIIALAVASVCNALGLIALALVVLLR